MKNIEDYTIHIGNNEWGIKFVDAIFVEEKEGKNTFDIITTENYNQQDDIVTLGICDNDSKVIAIATDDIFEDEIKITLFHEIIHAVAKEHNIDIPEPVVEEMGKIMFKTYCKLCNGKHI